MSLADAPKLKKEGNALFGKGKYAEAVAKYTAAIDLWMDESDRAVLYSNRSAARLKLAGEKPRALMDAERACQLAPTYAKGHFRRGQALRALGDPVRAAEAMEKVLEIEPSDSAATVALAELRDALAKMKPMGSGGGDFERSSQSKSAGSGSIAGTFASGTVVPSHTPKSKPFEAVAPSASSEFAAARPPPPKAIASAVPKKDELIVAKDDFRKLEGTAQRFMDAEEASKKTHAAKQPPKKPKTKAEEMGFLPWSFPPDFGPDAPDWDQEKWDNWRGFGEELEPFQERQRALEARRRAEAQGGDPDKYVAEAMAEAERLGLGPPVETVAPSGSDGSAAATAGGGGARTIEEAKEALAEYVKTLPTPPHVLARERREAEAAKEQAGGDAEPEQVS